MAKYTNQELANFILASSNLDNEAKSQLVHMLRSNTTYGLVWEDKPEEANEMLKIKIPVFIEDCEKEIKSSDKCAPNHVIIEGDNLHALSTLCYTHEGEFDVIYIDPPYNSGATDWKYNNDYVDRDDSYRHSKWLCMMEHRLKIAKRLLKPQRSVMIVTIDEKEFLHIGCLLEQLFPSARIQMISSVINPSGVSRGKEFYRTDEYIFFVKLGDAGPAELPLSKDWLTSKSSGKDSVRWRPVRRQGAHDTREDAPNQFYPIYLSGDGSHFVAAGESLPKDIHPDSSYDRENLITIWPIKPNGEEGCWQISQESLLKLFSEGYISVSKTEKWGYTIKYLAEGERKKIEKGLFPILGKDEYGTLIVQDAENEVPFIPGTQWRIPEHSAREQGTAVLNAIIGSDKFSYPKSIYAVHDALNFFVVDNPNAKILDFFAGSGTTMHATMLLNSEDGGHRQCFLVTNNENNICEDVTYERNKRVITGYTTPKGTSVEGLTGNSLRYFRTKFIDRSLTHQLKKEFVHSSTDILRIKENCFVENTSFGKLNLVGKEKLLRYFEECGRKLLVIYDACVIPFLVNEIKSMDLDKDELKVYIFADGAYPYTEDFRDVLDKISLVALPYAFNQALKHVLPSADDINIDTAELSEEEKEALISSAIESESNE